MIGRYFEPYPEYTQFIAPDGLVFNFNGFYKCMVSEEGWGMPPISYVTQKAPYQDGETVIDYFLNPRIIQLVLTEKARDRFGYWEARSSLLNAIRPNRSTGAFNTGVLRKKLPNGDLRDLNVVIEQGPGFSAREAGSWREDSYFEVLRFIAHDPIVYNPVQLTESWVLASSSHLIFEAGGVGTEDIIFQGAGGLYTGLIFGTAIINNSLSITYNGTYHTYPTILANGPIDGLTVRNDTLGLEIKLNYSVAAGEYVSIILSDGRKLVESSVNGNIIGSIEDATDLAVFKLECDPRAPGGVNDLTVIGTNVTGDTSVSICWNERYIGI